MCLSGSAFLVSFTDPNKQLCNVKPVLKFLNHGFIVEEICRFMTFQEIEKSFIKQGPLKLMSGNT